MRVRGGSEVGQQRHTLIASSGKFYAVTREQIWPFNILGAFRHGNGSLMKPVGWLGMESALVGSLVGYLEGIFMEDTNDESAVCQRIKEE